MNKFIKVLLLLFTTLISQQQIKANEPDSAYIFAYSTGKNDNHNGLHFAWSVDKNNWNAVGEEHSFLRSDYGNFGAQKKMIAPYLFQAKDRSWYCSWTLNEKDGAFAVARSYDLIHWESQAYPYVLEDGNCLDTDIIPNGAGGYAVRWRSDKSGEKYFSVTTPDFKSFTSAKEIAEFKPAKSSVRIAGRREEGTVHRVSWEIIEKLVNKVRLVDMQHRRNSERIIDDANRFANIMPIEAKLRFMEKAPRKISDLLLGVFFEDINYAADGGIYGELVQNRGFEYSSADRREWNNLTSWKASHDEVKLYIDSLRPLHQNNPHYAVVTNGLHGGIMNEGYGGIAVKKGEAYNFSIFARRASSRRQVLTISLLDKHGKKIASSTIKNITGDWAKHKVVLTASVSVPDAALIIEMSNNDRVDLDMVSLFPAKTFKGRENGMRSDLAEVIAAMKPKFVRFPGGCVAHGDGLDNMYHWKNTIGPLQARKPQRNLWGYQQSYGLGYLEYFQFCEDLDAEPVPVVAAGVPCQNSAHHHHALAGQQCGIPMEHMDDYVQDVLDLIEFANGDKSTKWGGKRAEYGHPEPFNLKYIGVGNEDLITEVFKERFKMIYEAVKAKYPEVKVIGTTGPHFEGTDYVEGWKFASQLDIPMVDEHYYVSPGWYINNQEFYDKYDREKPQVYLGEYAAHIPGGVSTVETALAEAMHLCNIERNADVVTMTSYAPLLAKKGFTQWNPDLIYFDNTSVSPTAGYEIQKLFGNNNGTEYIFTDVELSNRDVNVKRRVAHSVVRNEKTGEIIIKVVNMLPTDVNLTVDSASLLTTQAVLEIQSLSGKPDSKKLETSNPVFQGGYLKLAPYSFTVIKVRDNTLKK